MNYNNNNNLLGVTKMNQLKKLCIITLLIFSFLLPSNVVNAAKKEPKADTLF